MLGLHDKYLPLQDITVKFPVDVTPELEQLPIEVLRQIKAKADRFPRINP
jgi:hypothetical protein